MKTQGRTRRDHPLDTQPQRNSAEWVFIRGPPRLDTRERVKENKRNASCARWAKRKKKEKNIYINNSLPTSPPCFDFRLLDLSRPEIIYLCVENRDVFASYENHGAELICQ